MKTMILRDANARHLNICFIFILHSECDYGKGFCSRASSSGFGFRLFVLNCNTLLQYCKVYSCVYSFVRYENETKCISGGRKTRLNFIFGTHTHDFVLLKTLNLKLCVRSWELGVMNVLKFF